MKTDIQSKMRGAAMRMFPASANPFAQHAAELLALAEAAGRQDLLEEGSTPADWLNFAEDVGMV